MCVRFPIILVKLTSLRGSLSPDLWQKVMGRRMGPCAGNFMSAPCHWSSGKPAPDSPSYLLYPSAQSHGKILGLGGWFGLVLCWCLLVPSVPYVCPLAGCVAVRGLLGTQPRCAMNDAADQRRGQVFPCRDPGLQAACVCMRAPFHPSCVAPSPLIST